MTVTWGWGQSCLLCLGRTIEKDLQELEGFVGLCFCSASSGCPGSPWAGGEAGVPAEPPGGLGLPSRGTSHFPALSVLCLTSQGREGSLSREMGNAALFSARGCTDKAHPH